MPRIAVAFFGITRSLDHTIGSIRDNVLTPARAAGEVSVFCHFYRQDRIDNPRTGEAGALDPDEWRLLAPDRIEFDTPGQPPVAGDIARIRGFGDFWKDEFKTVSNLLHQLHSLKSVTRMALEGGPDIVIFCRPDLAYHDSLEDGIAAALAAKAPTVFQPRWQRFKGGFNDRFAICAGEAAIRAYGERVDQALTFCKTFRLPIHSEQLVRFALEESGVRIERLGVRASRVRAGGRVQNEDFTEESWKWVRNALRYRLVTALRRR